MRTKKESQQLWQEIADLLEQLRVWQDSKNLNISPKAFRISSKKNNVSSYFYSCKKCTYTYSCGIEKTVNKKTFACPMCKKQMPLDIEASIKAGLLSIECCETRIHETLKTLILLVFKLNDYDHSVVELKHIKRVLPKVQ